MWIHKKKSFRMLCGCFACSTSKLSTHFCFVFAARLWHYSFPPFSMYSHLLRGREGMSSEWNYLISRRHWCTVLIRLRLPTRNRKIYELFDFSFTRSRFAANFFWFKRARTLRIRGWAEWWIRWMMLWWSRCRIKASLKLIASHDCPTMQNLTLLDWVARKEKL